MLLHTDTLSFYSANFQPQKNLICFKYIVDGYVIVNKKNCLRDWPFNLKGYGFFLKKNSDSQCCWKKYSDFGGGKK